MPNVEITIGVGRTPEQLRKMMHEIHLAMLRTVASAPEDIRVVVHELPRSHWATGDTTLSEWDLRRQAKAGDPHRG
ncbi:tautomerase family protein [Mycolicibacterium porcinum]|uniref:tautomerase family protein n=1 Tax=Mycolicibacterium porcinum TaxID=39693 RepID=UPI0009F7385D